MATMAQAKEITETTLIMEIVVRSVKMTPTEHVLGRAAQDVSRTRAVASNRSPNLILNKAGVMGANTEKQC